MEAGNKVGKKPYMGQDKSSLIEQTQRLSAEAKENKRFVFYVPAGSIETLPGKQCFNMHSGCSASSADSSWHPVSLKRSRCVLCPCGLMAPEYTVHQCLPRLFTSVGLTYQAIESTWPSKPGHPCSPPGHTEEIRVCHAAHAWAPFSSDQGRRRLIS